MRMSFHRVFVMCLYSLQNLSEHSSFCLHVLCRDVLLSNCLVCFLFSCIPKNSILDVSQTQRYKETQMQRKLLPRSAGMGTYTTQQCEQASMCHCSLVGAQVHVEKVLQATSCLFCSLSDTRLRSPCHEQNSCCWG